MRTPEEELDAHEPELALRAEEAEDATGIGRREFMFRSLAAAAATTFGAHAVAAQAGTGSATAPVTPPSPQQQVVPPFPLGNGEPPAEQFMPYPEGTGALMEKMVREHGAGVFTRATFNTEPWSGTMPQSDEDLAFLPAHRIAALIKAGSLRRGGLPPSTSSVSSGSIPRSSAPSRSWRRKVWPRRRRPMRRLRRESIGARCTAYPTA